MACSSPPSVDFRLVFDTVPDCLVLLDTDAPRFTILAVTDAYLALTHATRDDVVGRSLLEIYQSDRTASRPAALKHLAASLERVLELRRADTMPSIGYDTRDGVNDFSKERMWSPVNTPVFSSTAGGDLLYIVHRVEDVTPAVAASRTAEEAVGRNGELLRSNAHLAAESLQQDQDLNRANEALRVMNAQLQAACREAEAVARKKSEFLANVSHEIRTPLNAIIGYAQGTGLREKEEEDVRREWREDAGGGGEEERSMHLLTPNQVLEREADGAALSPCHREQVEIIHKAGDHLLNLINEVLDMARLDAGKMTLSPRPVSPSSLLHEVAAVIQPLCAEKGLSLRVSLAPELPPAVAADGLRLRQMLLNLLGNAVKFTSQGEVRLAASVEGLERHEGDDFVKLCVTVSDTGAGISATDMPRLFTRFEQASVRATLSGTGLGLALARQISRMMGGDVTVESTVGVGSAFSLRVVLPLLPAHKLEPARAKAASPRVLDSAASLPILVADDIKANRDLLRTVLTKMGFRNITEAEDGASAVAAARREWPALVLTALFMNNTDGFSAARCLRQMPGGDRLPIVAVSASVLDRGAMATDLAIFNDFLPKPFRFEELESVLALRGGFVFSTPSPSAPALPTATPPSANGASLPSATRAHGPAPAAPDSIHLLSPPAKQRAAAAQRRRVLVVDDQAINRRLVRTVLEKAGHEPHECSGGAEAVRRLSSEDFDCVLMDLRMPGTNGVQAARQIRSQSRDRAAMHRPMIIALSADCSPEDLAACREAGMDGALEKPFRTRELLGLIEGRSTMHLFDDLESVYL